LPGGFFLSIGSNTAAWVLLGLSIFFFGVIHPRHSGIPVLSAPVARLWPC
jgi:hypothetical protein